MNDKYYMALAIELAKATHGQTLPNPSVGTVIVKNNQIVGIGIHVKTGEPHAEVHALNMAGDHAKDATLYVTLEPCSHFGKTPPCVKAIINSQIKRVVVATLDPNPLVNGKGIEELKQAGITVEVGIMDAEATAQNPAFFNYMLTGLPYVTIKAGISLDAKLATTTLQSKWITNSLARVDSHSYRHTHDAILVGVETIINDDPALTTRLANGGKNPIRIVLDTKLRTPLTAKIITDKLSPTWLIVGNQVSHKKTLSYMELGHTIIRMEDSTIEVGKLLPILAEKGITSLLVEGGAAIYTSFFSSKLFNQLVLYIAPCLIGGKAAPELFAGKGFAKLAETLKLEFKQIERLGNNLKIIALPKKEE